MKKNVRPRQNKIRVMIVDDHPMIRKALKNIIEAEPDLIIAAEADRGSVALDLVDEVRPNVILMDGSMPDMNGIETTERLKKLQPKAKIIGLTLYAQSTYLEEMVAVGASGYLLKSSPPENVIDAIRVVNKGGTYFDAAVPRRAAVTARGKSGTEKLTARELSVAKLLANGLTNSEIADSLGLKIQAVEAHRICALNKLKVRSRAELVRIAAERHWLEN